MDGICQGSSVYETLKWLQNKAGESYWQSGW